MILINQDSLYDLIGLNCVGKWYMCQSIQSCLLTWKFLWIRLTISQMFFNASKLDLAFILQALQNQILKIKDWI